MARHVRLALGEEALMNIGRLIIALTVATSMALGAAGCAGDGVDRGDDAPMVEMTRAELRQELRAAWRDHVTWTRMTLIATTAGLPDAPHASARLLRSQEAIGALHARFVGDEVGEDLAARLHFHVVAEEAVLAAARRGDAGAEADARATWVANGRAIADLLVAANPRLGRFAMRSLVQRHLDRSLDGARARLAGDWDADVAAADRNVAEVEVLADTLAEAIADAHGVRVGPPALEDAAGDALRLQLRAAWTDHATWTRLALLSRVAGLDDAGVATGRLLATQVDVGDALRPHLGDDVADRLTTLLEEHVVLGLLTVDEAQAVRSMPGASVVGAMAHERWTLHADAIGQLLVEANPTLDPAALRGMMRVLVDRTFAAAMARLDGDPAADVAAHDALQRHVVAMADVLADGAIRRRRELSRGGREP